MGLAESFKRLKELPPLDPKIVNQYATAFEMEFQCREGEGVDCTDPKNLTFYLPRDRYFDAKSNPTDGFRRNYLTIVEAHRKELVRQELTKFKTPISKFDLNTLPPQERAVAEELLKASSYLQDAYLKQSGSERFQKEMERQAAQGDIESYHLYVYNQGVACFFNKDPYCSSLSFFSELKDRQQYLDYYPVGMSKERCEEVAKLPNGNSHYTAVRGSFGGALKAISYSEAYGEYMRPAAQHLRNAAKLASFDPTLQTYLEKQAEALLSPKPHPVYEADQAWLKIGEGNLFVRFAADEFYGDEHCKRKAHYQVMLGVFDKSMKDQMGELATYFPRLEAEIEALVAEAEREMNPESPRPNLYVARNVNPTPIDFVRIIEISGDGRTPSGTQAGVTLPNWGGTDGTEEATKRTFALTYEGEAITQFFRSIAERVFTKDSLRYLNVESFNEDTIFHEFLGHFVGPHFDQPAIQEGKKVTKGDVFGNLAEALEEFKGIFAAMALPSKLHEWGYKMKQTPEEAVFFSLVYAARQLKREPGDSPYVGSSAVKFSLAIENGVLEFDEKEGKYRFHPDREKITPFARALYKKLLHFYASNDVEGFKQFLDYYHRGEGYERINHSRLKQLMADVPIHAVRTQPVNY